MTGLVSPAPSPSYNWKILPAVFEHMEPHLNTILGQSAGIRFNSDKKSFKNFFVLHVSIVWDDMFTLIYYF